MEHGEQIVQQHIAEGHDLLYLRDAAYLETMVWEQTVGDGTN